jgi:hypothetical protein
MTTLNMLLFISTCSCSTEYGDHAESQGGRVPALEDEPRPLYLPRLLVCERSDCLEFANSFSFDDGLHSNSDLYFSGDLPFRAASQDFLYNMTRYSLLPTHFCDRLEDA